VTPPIAVVDTNVVVSGLLTGAPDAPTRTILDAMLAGRISYVLSVALLAEYRSVLLRPAIQKRHGLSGEEVDRILEAIAANGVFCDPVLDAVDCPDPNDAHVWALLEKTAGAVLVTGDRALMDAGGPAGSVLSPASFAAMLAWER